MKAWPADRAEALGARLAERARRSVEAHRDYRTTRHNELRWVDAGPGVREALLDGEMFLGDILLRSGDYPPAPAGGRHVGATSECVAAPSSSTGPSTRC